MRTLRISVISVLAAALPAAYAQRWELGAGVAGSFYTSKDITAAATRGSAGFSSGYGATAILAHNNYRLVGGELRYTYGRNDLKLTSGGTKVNFGAQTHAVTYEFLVHSRPVGAKVRPYVAAGGGFKLFEGTGPEVVYQPLSEMALLTKTREFSGLLSVGGGVKIALSNRVNLRLEFRDHISPFPTKVFAAVAGAKIGRWTHNFLPIFGLTATF